MVEFINRKQLRAWLARQPRDIAGVLAIRAVLRVVPVLTSSYPTVLPVFRAVSAGWTAIAWNHAKIGAYVTAASNVDVAAAANPAAAQVSLAVAKAVEAVANPDHAFAGSAASAASAAVANAAKATANAAADLWRSISDDAAWLSEGRTTPPELALERLWPGGGPDWMTEDWRRLKTALLAAGEDWDVWTSWYDARVNGRSPNPELEIARVLEVDNKTWDAGSKVVNARIKEIIARFEKPEALPEPKPGATRTELAAVVSPAPLLTADNRLDAGPNVPYDAPNAGGDLPTLPVRQRALIHSILSGLPGQAPAHLRASLQSYDDELLTRGAQPILGLLKDMASIIEADVGDPNARREWLAAGLAMAFDNFLSNHDLFAKHFPLDTARDELYRRTLIDESAAFGPALAKPFEQVNRVVGEVSRAGLTTDDFVKIVASLRDFAQTTSTLPPPQKSRGSNESVPTLIVSPDDRVGQISPQKRTLLTGVGFFERLYNLVGSTASIASSPPGIALLQTLGRAIQDLLTLLL